MAGKGEQTEIGIQNGQFVSCSFLLLGVIRCSVKHWFSMQGKARKKSGGEIWLIECSFVNCHYESMEKRT